MYRFGMISLFIKIYGVDGLILGEQVVLYLLGLEIMVLLHPL